MEIFFGSMVVLAVGTATLLGYTFVLYRLGRILAEHLGSRLSPTLGAVLIGVAWLPVSLLALVVPVGPIVQIGLAICLYVVHAQPTCVGFWAGRALDRMESERRWTKNADDWLADWECREVPGEQEKADGA